MRTRVKICGISTTESTRHAVNAGADAIGLVFYAPSFRNITVNQAKLIVAAKPAFVSSVAVMVNPDTQFVRNVLDNVRPDYIQFHGDESAEFCRHFGVPYIRAVRIREDTDLVAVEREFYDASALLLDAYRCDRFGGTGDVFDWKLGQFHGSLPVILAGGLDADNVTTAIKTIAPYGVDVSSGVETDGIKEHDKIFHFCQTVMQSHTAACPNS